MHSVCYREYLAKFVFTVAVVCVLLVVPQSVLSLSYEAPQAPSYAPKDKDEGLLVQFAWVGHNLPLDTGEYPPFMYPVLAPFQTNFLTHRVKVLDEAFDMQWADETFDDTIPFWIWTFWGTETKIILDEEEKSLCYAATFGCMIPYAPKFKAGQKAYESPDSASAVLHTLDKSDIIFPLSLTSGGDFYQVIIFPAMHKSIEMIKEKHSKQESAEESLDMSEAQLPINAFVKKAAIRQLSKGHPSMRLDPNYTDIPVFFTPPLTRSKN